MRLRAPVLAALACLVVASSAHAAVAPGLVTHPVSKAPAHAGVTPVAATTSALLADGSIVTAGMNADGPLAVARLRPDGTLDPAFGAGGIVNLLVPPFSARQGWEVNGALAKSVLPLADGRMIVVTNGGTVDSGETAVFTRLLSDGRVDRSFGIRGSVTSSIAVGGSALQPDGRILMSGTTGKPGPVGPSSRFTQGTLAWTVARLTADGAPDPSFGDGGQVRLPAWQGTAIAAFQNGRIAATGSSSDLGASLAVLRTDGTLDPGFRGGAPAKLEQAEAHGVAPRSDGTVDVLAGNVLQRFRADGTPDATFGDGGRTFVSGDTRANPIVVNPDGSETIAGTVEATMIFTRLRPDGTRATRDTALWPRFGGTFVPSTGHLRSDGTLLVVGSLGVIQPAGEGEGFVHDELAVGAFRPDLTPDSSWGGPARSPALAVQVPAQRMRSILRRGTSARVRVNLRSSAPGEADVKVFHGGVLVARGSAELLHAGGGQWTRALLTPRGRERLRPGRGPRRVTVTATFRDLVGQPATARGTGVLR